MYRVTFTRRDWTEEPAFSCEGHGLAVAIARTTLKNRPTEYVRALVVPSRAEEQGEFDDEGNS